MIEWTMETGTSSDNKFDEVMEKLERFDGYAEWTDLHLTTISENTRTIRFYTGIITIIVITFFVSWIF